MREETKDNIYVVIVVTLMVIGIATILFSSIKWIVHKNDKEIVAEPTNTHEYTNTEVSLDQQKIKVKLKTPIKKVLGASIGCGPQPCEPGLVYGMVDTQEITLQEYIDLLPFVYEPAKQTSTPAKLIQVK